MLIYSFLTPFFGGTAWRVLSRHSLYAAATSNGGYGDEDDSSFAAIRAEFDLLRFLLSRAPLPGGRNDAHDDGLPVESDDNDGEGEASDDDVDVMMDFDLNDSLDVNPADYKLWESSVASSSAASDPFGGGTAATMMMGFGASTLDNIALRRHRQWQDFVKEKRRTSFLWSRRIPQIDSILAILSGDLSNVKFDSWAGQFCAELLYVNPALRPSDFSARIRRIRKDLVKAGSASAAATEEETGPEKVLLKIMKGEAGEAIQALWQLGGCSSAALPSTLVRTMIHFALYHLLVDSSNALFVFLYTSSSRLCPTCLLLTRRH